MKRHSKLMSIFLPMKGIIIEEYLLAANNIQRLTRSRLSLQLFCYCSHETSIPNSFMSRSKSPLISQYDLLSKPMPPSYSSFLTLAVLAAARLAADVAAAEPWALPEAAPPLIWSRTHIAPPFNRSKIVP